MSVDMQIDASDRDPTGERNARESIGEDQENHPPFDFDPSISREFASLLKAI